MSTNYEIRVRGRVGEDLAESLGMVAEVEPVETVLRGSVDRPDGLQSLLWQLQELGLELVELRRLPSPRPQS